MNVNPLIMSAKEEFGVGVYPNFCKEPTDSYIVFSYVGNGEEPIFHADDEEQYDLTTVRVHWYSKGDPQPLKKKLRRFLKHQGFDIVDTQEFYENDTQLNHIVVECAIDGVIDDEEED